MEPNKKTRHLLLVIALLIGATLAAYWGVWNNDFINYDDPDYVTANEHVQAGLTWEGVQWAFTTGHASNWHPVTWLSHMLDVTAFGLKPAGHHLTNLLFHIANSILLLLLLRQMTGALWRSAFVAALFALHPLHVESVAWVAERKDVLSAFFGLLTLMAYTQYVQSKIQDSRFKHLWYGVALSLFALGLMSKPMLVTWPFVMLLLDVWPIKRLQISNLKSETPALTNLLIEKVPFLALAIISSAVTIQVQQGAMSKTEIIPLDDRFCNAVLAFANYLQQTIWPANLAVFYPFPTSFPTMQIAIAVAIILAITLICLRQIKSRTFPIVGWLWFLGTLVPVIGLVQVGAQARADRYTYLPLIGIFFAASWGLTALIEARSKLKPIAVLISISALSALGIVSHGQLQHWRNDRALCSHAAKVTEGNYVAWGGLGIVDVKESDWTNAMANLTRAYEYAQPHHTERSVSYYIGVALQMQGKPKEALPYLEDCIVSAEMSPERDHRLGLSLMEAGRLAEAEVAIKSALEAKPQSLDYNLGLAALYHAKSEYTNAEATYRNSIAHHPDSDIAVKSYGNFLTLLNRHVEAEPQYAAAVRLNVTNAASRKAYANSLLRNGKTNLATEQLEEAFKLSQPSTQDLLDLAEIYSQLGQSQKVLKCYDTAVEHDPHSIIALNNLAWLLATSSDDTIRNGARAVELAERACKITEWKAAVLMGTLAAAYAEAGKFQEAVAMAEKARDRAREDKQDDIAKRNTEFTEFYRSGKPYREH